MVTETVQSINILKDEVKKYLVESIGFEEDDEGDFFSRFSTEVGNSPSLANLNVQILSLFGNTAEGDTHISLDFDYVISRIEQMSELIKQDDKDGGESNIRGSEYFGIQEVRNLFRRYRGDFEGKLGMKYGDLITYMKSYLFEINFREMDFEDTLRYISSPEQSATIAYRYRNESDSEPTFDDSLKMRLFRATNFDDEIDLIHSKMLRSIYSYF